MIHRILVPTDFSPTSINAIKWGAMIAKKTAANLHILHVIDVPTGWDRQPVEVMQSFPKMEAAMVESRIKLDKLVHDKLLDDVDVSTHLEGEVPFEQIINFAHANDIDLVVMGVHAAEQHDRSFISSTTQKVLRNLKGIPVLSVKTDIQPHPIERILFASSFDEAVGPAINTLKNLASGLGARIDLVTITTPANVIDESLMESRMKSFLHVQNRVPFDTVVYSSPDLEQGVLSVAKQRKADVITMATHFYKAKPDYLIGTTEGVLIRATVPIMSFVLNGY
jgi:nucleotide-binding universal stress UspA family protein